jgi:site-specific recombinase XerD
MNALPITTLSIDSDGAARFAAILSLWLGRFRSPHTVRAYKHDLGLWFDAGCPVDPEGLQRWVESLTGTEATRARRLQAVRSFMRWATLMGALKHNAMEVVASAPSSPRMVRRTTHRYLTRPQVFAVLSKLDAPWAWVAYATGARVSELTGATVADVQVREDRTLLRLLGKGNSERTVALWGKEAERLRDLVTGREDRAADLLFGEGCPRTLNRKLGSAAQAVGIPSKISAHWLRHAHISHSLDRGASLVLVQSTVGHRSLAATQHYAHAAPSDSSSRFVTF